jgi:hypothetical protein
MGERRWKHISVFVNFENILYVRQDRYQAVILPLTNQPSFREVWAPLEGFVANGGLKPACSETMGSTLNAPIHKGWKIATGLAVFIVIYNLGEGLVSLYFGAHDKP